MPLHPSTEQAEVCRRSSLCQGGTALCIVPVACSAFPSTSEAACAGPGVPFSPLKSCCGVKHPGHPAGGASQPPSAQTQSTAPPPCDRSPSCRHRQQHHGREQLCPPGAEDRRDLPGDEHHLRGLPAPPRGTRHARPRGRCPPPAPAWPCLSQQEQLWAVCAGYDDIYVWGLRDLARPPERVHLPNCAQVTCMIRVKRQVRGRPGGLGLGSPSPLQPVVLTPVPGRCGWAAPGCRRGSPGGRSTWSTP